MDIVVFYDEEASRIFKVSGTPEQAKKKLIAWYVEEYGEGFQPYGFMKTVEQEAETFYREELIRVSGEVVL